MLVLSQSGPHRGGSSGALTGMVDQMNRYAAAAAAHRAQVATKNLQARLELDAPVARRRTSRIAAMADEYHILGTAGAAFTRRGSISPPREPSRVPRSFGRTGVFAALPGWAAGTLPSVAQPLEAHDEYEVIRGINQESDQPLVMLAEM